LKFGAESIESVENGKSIPYRADQVSGSVVLRYCSPPNPGSPATNAFLTPFECHRTLLVQVKRESTTLTYRYYEILLN